MPPGPREGEAEGVSKTSALHTQASEAGGRAAAGLAAGTVSLGMTLNRQHLVAGKAQFTATAAGSVSLACMQLGFTAADRGPRRAALTGSEYMA